MITCDFCGGVAVGCFIGGVPHYHCEGDCVGFLQLEMFEDGPSLAGEVREGREASEDGDLGLRCSRRMH